MKVYARLRLGLLLLAGVILVGITGFHYLEAWPWLDSLYMTLITLTTVGYGEVHPLSPTGRVFTSFLLVIGVSVEVFTLGVLTQAMLEFELGAFLGRRRMERELGKISDHYIVCGAGRVGRSVARELRARPAPVVIIEKEPAHAQWAIDEGIPVIIGAGTTEEVLRRARIEYARGLVAAVTSDADNLYIVLTARGLCPELKIIARVSEEEAIPKLLRAGATHVFSPYQYVGHRIAQCFLRPNVLRFIDAAITGSGGEREDVQIEEVQITGKSHLVGKTLAQSDLRKIAGVMVVGLKHVDGAMSFNPSPESVIQSGDFVIAIGRAESLKKLESLAAG